MASTGRAHRRLLPVLAAVLALFLGGCGAFGDRPSGPAAGGALRIGLPTGVTSFANSDVVVADAKGFFARQGLQVEVQNLRSGVSVVQGVVGGALDIGAASIEPVLNAAAGGGDVAIIGSYADRLTVSAVTPTTITTAADLRGQRVGVQEVGAFREVMSRLVLESGGLTPQDVQYVPVDAQSYTSALIDGRIQSAILQTEQAVDAIRNNPNLRVLVDMNQVVQDWHYGTYFTARGWLDDNGDIATRFMTAITEAHRFMYDNRAETVQIVAGATEFSPEVIDAAYETLLARQAVFPVNTGLDRERISATIAETQRLGVLENDPPQLDELIDEGPVRAAVDRLGERTGDDRWR
jgi:NitT/TauT family transport system substrate-binding protein